MECRHRGTRWATGRWHDGSGSFRYEDDGPIDTLYARRIDVVRARPRLLNVPLPESGYRCGDVVHDGSRGRHLDAIETRECEARARGRTCLDSQR